MTAQKYYPSPLTAAMLDAFLAKGWFRMGQSVFTTHFLRFQQQFYPAVWLRYQLEDSLLRSLEPKLNRIEKRFDIEIQPWILSAEQEELFTLYRRHSGLEMATSLQSILLDYQAENVFPTYQVCIRDGARLVGLGIFDLGNQSAAGISNVYHPEYKKYSLGKVLMQCKLRYCTGLGLKWFYPGYAVPGYSRFDYKLQVMPALTEYYHGPLQAWMKYDTENGLPNFMEQIIRPLYNLYQLCKNAGHPARMVFYPPFDLALADNMLPEVITVPAFLLLGYDPDTEISTVAIYDLAQEGFSMASCKPLYKNGWALEADHWCCFDVLQLIETTDPLFSDGEILKITGV